MFFLLFLFSFPIACSEKPTISVPQTVLNEMLDQLTTVNKVYAKLVDGGMSPGLAAIFAAKWQDKHYPIYLNPVKETEDSKDTKKSDKVAKKDE